MVIFRLTRVVPHLCCAAALILFMSASALAQGLYYKEIAKDGRIYVFNVAANAERFEKTGEMGVGITKPGAGPERRDRRRRQRARASALSSSSTASRSAVPDPVAAGADDRLARRQDAHHDRQRLPRDLEPRAGAVHRRGSERTPRPSRTGRASAPAIRAASWRIRRAKFKLEGWMIKPWLTYETQMNWPAADTARNIGAFLEDAAFDVDFSKGRGMFRLHVGQFKPPYGTQEMTSSGNQQFVDRALVSNSFFRGRDTGIALWGVTPNNKFEWRVGAFNGNGLTRSFNDNNAMQIQRAADVAAQRQPGPESARVGDAARSTPRATSNRRRCRSTPSPSTTRTRTTSRRRPARPTRSGTPSASTGSSSSRASR